MEHEVFQEAFNISVKYLSYRQRTENEVIEYLKKRGYKKTVIFEVLNRLREVNYIDDNKYAINYLNSAIAKQNKGIDLVRRELLKKGVDDEIVLKHMHLFSIEKEMDYAINIAINYFLVKKDYPPNQIKEKIYNRLLRKGFSNESIKVALFNLDKNEKVRSIIEEQQEQYKKQIINLSKKYYEKYSKNGTNKYKLKEKIFAQLMRKGYDYYLIESVIEKIME